MKNLFATLVCLCTISALSHAQLPQKFDSLYKTIFAKDFCKMIQQNPNIVLLDVRSPGEYADTSVSTSLNIGHLKGAINMGIDSMKKNMAALDAYRSKTLVIYCSHSQRSRRVSKLLSENGFTNFYNLNGGLSSLNQLTARDFPCKQDWLQTNLPYKNLSVPEALVLHANEKKLVVVDVRPASHFELNDSAAERNIGRIKGAINIPYDKFSARIAELNAHKNSPVLVYTMGGDGDAARAASQLAANGFKTVYHLVGGIDGVLTNANGNAVLEKTPAFHCIDAEQALGLLKSSRALTVYDARPKIEFENKDEKFWKNLGNIKNAVNVSASNIAAQTLPADKKAPILVYGNPGAFVIAKTLSEKGYTAVYSMDSLYDFIWSGFNIESCKESRNYVVNHDGLF